MHIDSSAAHADEADVMEEELAAARLHSVSLQLRGHARPLVFPVEKAEWDRLHRALSPETAEEHDPELTARWDCARTPRRQRSAATWQCVHVPSCASGSTPCAVSR